MHLCAHRKRSRRMCNSLLIRRHPWWGVALEVIGNWPCFTLEPSVLDFYSFSECILNTLRISNYYVVKASKLINVSYFQKFIRNLSGKPQSLLNTWQGALSWIQDFHFCAQNFWPVRAHTFFWVFSTWCHSASLAARNPDSPPCCLKVPWALMLVPHTAIPSDCLTHDLPSEGRNPPSQSFLIPLLPKNSKYIFVLSISVLSF